jgi:hypothetical protein
MMLHSKHSRKQMKKTVADVRNRKVGSDEQRGAHKRTWHSKDVRHLDGAMQLLLQEYREDQIEKIR